MMIRRHAIYLLLPAFFSFSGAASAFEYCECAREWTPLEAWERSAAVFSGKVTAIRDYGEKKVRVTFEVDRSWKGPAEHEMSVYTARDDAYGFLKYGISCGVDFAEGQDYLVYAHTEKLSPLQVDKCLRTRPLGDAAADIQALGPAYVSFANGQPVYAQPGSPAGALPPADIGLPDVVPPEAITHVGGN
jgi:hypothetical protein